MSVRRKCYISYKFEDEVFKNIIIKECAEVDFIDKSQDEEINSTNPEVIIRTIREKYLKDSTVTIFLIGDKCYENYRDEKDLLMGYDSQIIIRREITASLYNGVGNTRNGLLGVVLPTMTEKIYGGVCLHPLANEPVNYIHLNDTTVIKEFWSNYFSRKGRDYPLYHDEDCYAVLVSLTDFLSNPSYFIEKAFEKRFQEVSNFVKVKVFN